MTPMYQRLTDAISAIDDDHWVFFEPPNLASLGIKTSLGEVKGPKVAIYPHMYDASIETATYSPDGEIELDPEFFDKWADAITTYTDKYPVPMMVGEWGIASPETPGMDEFVERTMETLDRVTSGWSVWAWCRGDGYCPVDANGNDVPGIGQIFQPYARAIAGAPTSTTWDRDAKVLRLRFADNTATGTTDIYIGADRSFPDGWKVETSDADGTWTSTYDDTTGVLSVTTAKTGEPHATCVMPAATVSECLAVDPEEPMPAPPAPPAPPVAPGAVPVSAHANFTG